MRLWGVGVRAGWTFAIVGSDSRDSQCPQGSGLAQVRA